METATALVIEDRSAKDAGSRPGIARAASFLRQAGFQTATMQAGAAWPAGEREAHPDFVLLSSRGGPRLIVEVKKIHRKTPNAWLLVVVDALDNEAASKAYTAGATAVVPPAAAEHAVRNLLETTMRWGRTSGGSAQPKTPKQAVATSLEDALVDRFHDPATGRLDAGRVAEAFGISLSALAKGLKVTQSALSKRPTAAAAQAGLRELESVWATLVSLLTTEARAKAWLWSNRRDLKDQPPIRLLTDGSAQALADYMRSVVTGEPG